MADYTAIFEVGESIVNVLRNKMVPEPIAKTEQIGLCEPQSPEDFQLTVWIYNIEMVKDSGTRTGFQPDPENPALERFSPMQVRLQILVSAHSKAPAIQRYADEYRIIGRALQTLRDVPSIPQEFLVGSLVNSTEPVLMEIKKLESEELSMEQLQQDGQALLCDNCIAGNDTVRENKSGCTENCSSRVQHYPEN